MRAKEFINENATAFNFDDPAIPGGRFLTGLKNAYELYRFGLDLAIASNPDAPSPNKDDTVAYVTMAAYTPEEDAIITKLAKKHGFSQSKSSKLSTEQPGVNSKSPVAGYTPTKRPKR
jgi:hypothetical protein